ncbi:hypothetical protein DL98DRAFT_593152 [Cadophora sp. DSE1049]|nr:hypothetical protein DL98DRAFT_593152 [Cadophora sp. DSE1049]
MVRPPTQRSKALFVSTTFANTSNHITEQLSRVHDPILEDEVEYSITAPGAKDLEEQRVLKSIDHLPVARRSKVIRFSDCVRVSHGHRTSRVWVPITQFSLFPKLPLELRLMIWVFALSTSQIVAIGYEESGRPYEFTASEKQSSIRQVNKEARAEALKIQTLACDKDIRLGVSGIYVNPNVDIFWVLSGGGFRESYSFGELYGVKQSLSRIALPAYEWFFYMMYDDMYEAIFSFLTARGVEEVFIIVGSEAAWSCTDKVFTEPRGSPHRVLDQDFVRVLAENPGLEGLADGTISWATLGECETKENREFQEVFHRMRMHGEAGDDSDEDSDLDSDSEAVDTKKVAGSSGGTIKKITFVEGKQNGPYASNGYGTNSVSGKNHKRPSGPYQSSANSRIYQQSCEYEFGLSYSTRPRKQQSSSPAVCVGWVPAVYCAQPSLALLAVNRESRDEAMKVQRPNPIPCRTTIPSQDPNRKFRTIHANLDIDIIWIQGIFEGLHSILSGDIYPAKYGFIPTRSHTAVMSWAAWTHVFKEFKEVSVLDDVGTIGRLVYMGIQEVLLVEGTYTAPNRRDITFVAAKHTPKLTDDWKQVLDNFRLDHSATFREVEQSFNARIDRRQAQNMALKKWNLGNILPPQNVEHLDNIFYQRHQDPLAIY